MYPNISKLNFNQIKQKHIQLKPFSICINTSNSNLYLFFTYCSAEFGEICEFPRGGGEGILQVYTTAQLYSSITCLSRFQKMLCSARPVSFWGYSGWKYEIVYSCKCWWGLMLLCLHFGNAEICLCSCAQYFLLRKGSTKVLYQIEGLTLFAVDIDVVRG